VSAPAPLRVLVADDEPLARASLRTFLTFEAGAELIGEAADGREALEAIAREDPDVVFLDVDMPELDGFGVLEALGDARMPVVVFCTAHEHYALRAFDVHAQDYLVKPFGRDRFRQALARAREAVEERDDELRGDQVHAMLQHLREEQQSLQRLFAGSSPYLERMMVKTRDRALLLPTAEIDWVEAEGNYVKLHVEKEAYLVRWKIGALEERLDPRVFARIHRSTIVNLDRVKELRPWFAGDFLVVLKDGAELKLSRGYRAKLEEQMGSAG
jgi:two-component system LytT family response regulator